MWSVCIVPPSCFCFQCNRKHLSEDMVEKIIKKSIISRLENWIYRVVGKLHFELVDMNLNRSNINIVLLVLTTWVQVKKWFGYWNFYFHFSIDIY